MIRHGHFCVGKLVEIHLETSMYVVLVWFLVIIVHHGDLCGNIFSDMSPVLNSFLHFWIGALGGKQLCKFAHNFGHFVFSERDMDFGSILRTVHLCLMRIRIAIRSSCVEVKQPRSQSCCL